MGVSAAEEPHLSEGHNELGKKLQWDLINQDTLNPSKNNNFVFYWDIVLTVNHSIFDTFIKD